MDNNFNRELPSLRELSDLDTRISEIQAEIKNKNKKLHEYKDNLIKKNKEYEEKVSKVKTNEHVEHFEEIQLKEVEAELDKIQNLLNNASNNEEYSLLLKKRDNIKKNISELEDAVLEKLDNIEKNKEELIELQQTLSVEKDKVSSQSEQIEKEIVLLKDEINKLRSQRDNLKKNISREALNRYDRVLEKEKIRVVVSVRNGTCQGCYISVTPQQINVLMRGDTLVFCKKCNRILYIAEEEN
ncbi:MAG: C4-type zinc ribbon domain-containing protein [Planctomycetota bacterium]